jgi:hypothetical protein
MSLDAAVAAELPFLRHEAGARFGCRMEVRRLTGRTAQNEATGREVPTYEVVHADVPCRLPSTTRATGAREAGAALRPEVDREVHTSADLPLTKFGWFIVITTVDELTNPGLVGQVFRVTDPHASDQVTARRIAVTGEGVPMEMVLDADG